MPSLTPALVEQLDTLSPEERVWLDAALSRAAAALMDPDRWTTGASARDAVGNQTQVLHYLGLNTVTPAVEPNPTATRFCAVGHIVRASAEQTSDMRSHERVAEAALHLIQVALGDSGQPMYLADVNDGHNGRIRARRAIDRAHLAYRDYLAYEPAPSEVST